MLDKLRAWAPVVWAWFTDLPSLGMVCVVAAVYATLTLATLALVALVKGDAVGDYILCTFQHARPARYAVPQDHYKLRLPAACARLAEARKTSL